MAPIEKEPVLYQEIDIDEANPEDNEYDPKVNKKVLNLILRKILNWKKL